MAEAILDASAVLAFVQDEPGGKAVSELMAGAIVSSVNAVEVISKLVDRGMPSHFAQETMFEALPCRVVAFDSAMAALAGQLRARTRPLGLSLGDRACLALALACGEGVPVLTTDREWARLDLGLEIKIVR